MTEQRLVHHGKFHDKWVMCPRCHNILISEILLSLMIVKINQIVLSRDFLLLAALPATPLPPSAARFRDPTLSTLTLACSSMTISFSTGFRCFYSEKGP
ncbi:hypothetical protein ACSBR1_030977 [Camellia fascicularis]